MSVRPLTAEEKQRLTTALPTRYGRVEAFVLKLVFIAPALLTPPLLLNHFRPVSASTQLSSTLVIVALALGSTHWLTRKYERFDRRAALAAIATGQAEIMHVLTSKAVAREDPEDFGAAFYCEVQVAGKLKLLYLQGQYLDELDESVFPNTEFEIIRRIGTREVLAIQLVGQAFQSEKTLLAFPMALWRNGSTPEDGAVLPGSLAELHS